MYIAIFYAFLVLYTYLFTLLVNVEYSFTNPWLYGAIILGLIISTIIAFITAVLSIEILGFFRKNKGPFDKTNHRFANSICHLAVHLMRVKVTVTGRENIPEGNFVLYGNHQENYDILILKPIFKDHIVNFIAKEALSKLPIFGKWIAFLGNVFISKNADRSAAESIIKGIRNYKSGMSMAIFPEGKRSFSNELIDFKPGAFKLAMKPKADILIVTQYDVCTIFKSFPWKRYNVKVHIHPLFKHEEYEGMKSQEVSNIVKDRIQKQLDIFKSQTK